MNTAKTYNKQKDKKAEAQGNPFIKLLDDKAKISKAIQKGESFSTLKNINFVKPL